MGEFIQAASRMTEPVQQMMFEGAKTVVSQTASGGFIPAFAIDSVKNSPATWVIGGITVVGGCLYQGVGYFWVKPLLENTKKIYDELRKREMPEDILRDFETRAKVLFDGIENKIASLNSLAQSLRETNIEYSRQAQELNVSQNAAHEQVTKSIEIIERLFSELKGALDKLGTLRKEIEQADGKAYWVYEATIKQEERVQQLLQEKIERNKRSEDQGGEQ